MLNELFHSVFNEVQKENFFISTNDILIPIPKLANFRVLKPKLHERMSTFYIPESRGLNGLPPAFYQNNSRYNSSSSNNFLKTKRLRKTPDRWKDAAVSPMYRKDSRQNFENYRPVSILDTDNKLFYQFDFFIKISTNISTIF